MIRSLSRFLFFLCIPAIIWNAPLHAEENLIEKFHENPSFSPWELLNYETLSFDRIMDFVNAIEYGDFLENCTEKQYNETLDFLAFLARNGVSEDDAAAVEKMEWDIQELYSDEPEWKLLSLQDWGNFSYVPAVLGGGFPKVFLCKSWMHKKYKQSKRWVKKHKKAIIIAGVVVVAATVVIVATAGTGTAAVGAIGGAAATAASTSTTPVNKPGEVVFEEDRCNDAPKPQEASLSPKEYIPQPESIPVPTQEILVKQTSEIKEELKEIVPEETLNILPKEEPSFWSQTADKARELGSTVAHTVVDGTASTLESAGRLGWSMQDDYQKPRGSFDEAFQKEVLPLADQLHQKIDQSFNTNYAGQYGSYANQKSPESMGDLLKELGKDVAFCFVPVPGSQLNKLSKVFKTARAVVKTAKAAGVIQGAAASGAAIGSTLTKPIPEQVPTIQETKEIQPVPREQGNITVYQSINENTGNVQYVGITNDVARRYAEHYRNKGIRINSIKGLTNLTEYDSRAVEQALVEIHKLKKHGGTLSNRINSIAKTNPKYAESVARGAEILREIEYDGAEEVLND